MLPLQDWTICELLACLDWLSDTVKATGQQDPQHNWLQPEYRMCKFRGENKEQEDVNEL